MSIAHNHPNQKGLAKYYSLVFLVASFFALVVVLSAITFVISQKIANATKEFEQSAQQTVLIQQLSKNLLDLNLYLQAVEREQMLANVNVAVALDPASPTASTLPAPTPSSPVGIYSINALPQVGIYQLSELNEQTLAFTNTLNALKHGGTLKDAQGNDIVVQAVTDPKLQETLSKIEVIWTPYRGLVENFVEDTKKGVIKKQTSDYLVDYTRLYNNALQSEMLIFSSRQNSLIQDITHQLRLAQIIGVSVAFVLFLAIVFGSLRQLSYTDRQLDFARQQTDDIMRTVNEGLFLIDQDLVIADQYSTKLEEILNQRNIAGRTLYDVLKGMIDNKDMQTTELFVEQLYNVWVVEELIQDLNPLKQVMLSYIDENGMGVTRFLDFNFLRVMDEEGESVEGVLVSVADVTNEIRLQAQMQKDKEQHDRQIEMIGYLLNADAKQIGRFMNETKVRLERMNDILRSSGHELRAKAEQLYREVHSLKGDASAVNLGALIGLAEKQEERLKQIIQHFNPKGDDFLPFTVGLDEMVSMVTFIDNLVHRLNLQSASPEVSFVDEVPVQNDAHGHWQDFFEKYGQDVAKRQGKEIVVRVIGFDGLDIRDDEMAVYKDIAVQLLKNAIVHGIELPDERLAKGKARLGLVELSLQAQGDSYSLQVKDDGAGIDWAKLRDKAVEMGICQQEQAETLQPKDLLKLMFKSGLSTAQTQDEDAGRGVGMDVVKQLAVESGGKIGVNSRSNQFTRIHITFPKN